MYARSLLWSTDMSLSKTRPWREPTLKPHRRGNPPLSPPRMG
ncbi:MAG: hypothetical protein O4965_05440 [Trichodesmium sp. St19_bin1]|nr:hypothetical protein [Trichodesmium sp. St19_bin1]